MKEKKRDRTDTRPTSSSDERVPDPSEGSIEQELQAVKQKLESSQRSLEQTLLNANQMSHRAAIEFSQIFNASHDGIWVVDTDFNVTHINNTFLKILQKSSHEVLHKKCYEVFPLSLCHTRHCSLKRVLKQNEGIECDIECEVASKNKRSKYAFILSASPFYGVNGEIVGIVGSYKDITDRKRAEALLHEANMKLEQLAITDALTQLANRRKFDEYLVQEWKRGIRDATPLSLIMCDVDYFKLYNDTYGHQAGDECLKQLADVIRNNVKRPTDLAARYGGEEFAIILPNTNAEGAIHIAELIRMSVRTREIAHSRSSVSSCVSISLGVYSDMPTVDTEPIVLVNNADKALYQAKQTGRNRTVYYQTDEREHTE